MCRKVALAKHSGDPEIEIWGDGEQTRSFCYIDDCVEGIHRLMASDYAEPLNLGQDRLIRSTSWPTWSPYRRRADSEGVRRRPPGRARPQLGQYPAARGARLGAADLARGGSGAHLRWIEQQVIARLASRGGEDGVVSEELIRAD